MKTTHVFLGAAAVLAVVAGGIGRFAWRAHHDIVTLHVRNAPLRAVIASLERQTREAIPFDKKLDARVTLNLTSKPLAEVLDRIAEQCGARWSTLYAAYSDSPGLSSLESSLRGEKSLTEAGWKLVAPSLLAAFPPASQPNSGGGLAGVEERRQTGSPATTAETGSPKVVIHGGPEVLPQGKKRIVVEEDVVVGHGPAVMTTPPDPSGPIRIRLPEGAVPSPVVRVVRRQSGDGQSGVQEEVWTPAELVVPVSLAGSLKDPEKLSPTPEGAKQAAREISGKWKQYFVLRKSPLGMGFVGMPNLNLKLGTPSLDHNTNGTSTNLTQRPMPEAPAEADLEAAIRQQKLNELGRLTPQQRVQLARERQNAPAQ
jgi:hypothetical protein